MKLALPKLTFPKFSLPRKGKFQTKHILGVLAIGVLAIFMLHQYGVLDAVDFLKWKKTKEKEITFERKRLVEFEQVLREREGVENDRRRVLKQSEDIQVRLLAAETPQLGAALLQDIVRQVSEKNSISLRSFRTLEPKDLGIYRRISLQIDFNPSSSMKSLGQFIYDLERHPKALMVSEMDLLIFNPRMANNIQGNLVISALMPGSKAKERKKEEKGKTEPMEKAKPEKKEEKVGEKKDPQKIEKKEERIQPKKEGIQVEKKAEKTGPMKER
jgi:hypothetical protein